MPKTKSKVWVDADSCPVQKEITAVCNKFHTTPQFVATINHYKPDPSGEEWIYLDHGSQSVDLYILNHVKPHDIVITQDLSLGVLLTPQRVYVLTPRGKLINEGDAVQIMNQKHLRQRTLKRKKKWKGPKAFTTEDREQFSRTLDDVLQMSIRESGI
ncbi:DUF188 domain-containing protein [Halobacillus massiliensis]|uniref:DUF188 domain-containing protein n=1 Tax=Halobacillus massiliensis TaxID=1926286 RepID=UPI0009E4BE40|nr:DUF188 domain-containing protein [Halobacillus massiliensis]